MSAKAKGNGRKKCSDRQSKNSLYEKHIPHISEAIGSIISKSRNREFKIRCQELLKVDSPEKVQEAISSKLFTLMLGDQYDPKTPHNKGDDNLSTASCTDTSFGDLADHVENHDEQRSSAGKPFESARNARRQTATESAKNTYGELKRLEFKESHPMESVVTTSCQSHVMSNAIGSQIMVDKAVVDPAVFLGVVFLLVVGLIVVYKVIVNQSCACLSDPGGKDAGRKKKQNGYSPVSGRETESSDGDVFVPPTLIVENEESNLEEGELVGPQTLSAYSVYSAYGDTISLDQSYLTERGLGRLKLDVSYKPDESRLKILVIEGDSLPSKEQGGASQFKIHLTLLPKRQQKFKSKTQSRYSPRFNETFEFKDVLESDLFTLAVRFRLYGGTGTGKLVGETFLQLADVARAPGHVIQGTWRAFREVKTREKKK